MSKFETLSERVDDYKKLWQKFCDQFSGAEELLDEGVTEHLAKMGFFTAPASTKYHGAYEGGLYEHSRAVAGRLIRLTRNNNLTWQRPESPFIIGMFHDLCKCDQYIWVPDKDLGAKDGHYEYNTNTLLKGHGDKSIILLSQFLTLTEEEILCIRYHMGAYERDDWDGFDKAIHKYSTVLYSHTADMLASKVDGI